ncbi:hypothetical protein GYMLUDRAFT_608133 [Collybiopsis luxurians FD-317 M1]|uniref:Uncharacterized protein n=1 Tax=Collybiopsis luxurians FD-317 M1 TaxID=944289 RepID=A0A0D0CNT1_9AGAR|nr:hypothetical protein GYMLUDRAFT_608133 [Collybiopsis luxurians FD-317 M1]
MASTREVRIHYDSTFTHLVSEKAIVEGWDTFIFYNELIQPGTLVLRLNTKRSHLSTKDVVRWISIMSHGTPPMIYRRTMQSASILSYLPDQVERDSVNWGSSDVWEPGNFMLKDLGNTYDWGMIGVSQALF